MGTNQSFNFIFDLLEWIITVFLIIIFLLTVVLVVLRYVFNSSIIGGNELTTFLFIYTTAIGAAVAIPRNRHIRIDYFVEKLGGPARVAAEVFGFLCVGGINFIMFIYSLDWIKKVGTDLSQSLGIPLGLIKVSVPIGCFLAFVFSLYAIITIIVTGRPIQREDQE